MSGGDGRDLTGAESVLIGLEAAIADCERALATLDAAGCQLVGAHLSFALDRMRDARDAMLQALPDAPLSDSRAPPPSMA